MSKVIADTIQGRDTGNEAPDFPKGATVTGIVTATSFSGSGANLTGIANTDVVHTREITATGIVTFSNTTSGLSTTTGTLILGGGIGVGGSVHLNDSKGIILGSGADLQIVHDHVAGDSYIVDAGTGALKLDASEIVLQHAQTAKITTNPSGIVVNGITTVSNSTDSSSTTTGALIISGGVGIAKSMYIGGNIAFADGQGLDFSASADGSGTTVSSEVLDDYEEGLWTGVLKYDSNTPTTDSNVCQYVKVGNLCHAQGRISVTNDPGGNALTCEGLPFAASNPTGDGNAACGSVYMEETSANVDYGWVVSFVGDAGTTIMFRQSGMTDAGNAVADHADSGTNYMFSVVYRTA